MKKLFPTILALVCAICCMFSLVACGSGENHTHKWSATYTQDSDRHYQTCDGCNEKNYASHSYVNGVCVCGKQKPETTVAVESVTLNKNEITLTIEATETLTATVMPDNATDKAITWTSDKPAVASVDNSGKVTVLSAGTAIITATAGGKSANCTVTVNAAVVRELKYKEIIENGEVVAYEVTGIGTVTDSDVTIPSVYNGKPVRSIGSTAFMNCMQLESVIISEGITEIGGGAFSRCSKLTSVTIPQSVTYIGNNVFVFGAQHIDVYYCGTEERWNEVSKFGWSGMVTSSFDTTIDYTMHYANDTD